MSKIQLSKNFIKSSCKLALNEDLYPSGDITSDLINKNIIKSVKMISNENGILGGIEFAKETFKLIDKKIKFKNKKIDGSSIKRGEIIAIIEGNLKNILTGERVALNFVSHISGIASKTNLFVKIVGKKTKICCTRKTIPNLRVIQKYGVKLGGGINHRFNLSDEYLIKDNHISSEKNFENLIQRAIKNKVKKKITVEVDNISQLKRILGLKFDRILLDNMSSKNLRKAVTMSRRFYETEASGGITLKNVKKISSTGVDRISVGCLTHSVNALDLKLEI
ncbi:carboxylating nicotinate-nucleotide diphosphorylase [Candidatus Pelagibacter sp.]|nr:carboxylating nicotinate-nucleotide diphosphorylase [Candidatus Pelagibacter sp.]